MLTSGSKGSEVNMGQMGGCIGQTAVEGKRVQKKCNNRTLPYYFQNDDSAIARGFIQESFMTGASPEGFIFHNMGSREGLIDTAIKSLTGGTPIVILEDGVTKKVLIGDWIDEKLLESKDKVEHHKERELELLNVTKKLYITTADEDGQTSWGLINAVTRHDPGNTL